MTADMASASRHGQSGYSELDYEVGACRWGRRCLSVFFSPTNSCLLLVFPLWTSASGRIPQLCSLTPLGPPHGDTNEKPMDDVS